VGTKRQKRKDGEDEGAKKMKTIRNLIKKRDYQKSEDEEELLTD